MDSQALKVLSLGLPRVSPHLVFRNKYYYSVVFYANYPGHVVFQITVLEAVNVDDSK